MLRILSAKFLTNFVKFGQHLAKLFPKYKGCRFYSSQCRCL